MMCPFTAGTAENIGQLIGGGSIDKGIGGPRIGTIGVFLLHILPLVLALEPLELLLDISSLVMCL